MKLIILRIVAFLTKRKVVLLEDFEGDYYYTIETISPFGKRIAYVFHFFKIRPIALNEDGTCTSYIDRWKYI